MKKILIIQTAFIGDVILATSLVDFIKEQIPECEVHFLLRKGNESLLQNHENIDKVIVWNKKEGKIKNLIKLALQARKEKYDYAFNIQRFASSGFFTFLCGAKVKVGFKQNPLSFLFTASIDHMIPHFTENSYYHEVQRNLQLLEPLFHDFKIPNAEEIRPSLTITKEQFDKVKPFESSSYLVLAPSSVWFTKQWNIENWKDLTAKASISYQLYFIGGPDDKEFIQSIIGENKNCTNLCGKLSLVESAALMKNAKRVFVNDSAPLHLASAVNAKTTAIFCSTIPEFGYFPLASDSKLIQLSPRLECMPCGLHGKRQCPLGHFKCAVNISVDHVISTI